MAQFLLLALSQVRICRKILLLAAFQTLKEDKERERERERGEKERVETREWKEREKDIKVERLS